MSNTGWFDSSFSFAKQALNQAQKSIDRVLDIKEKQGGSEQDEKPVASGPDTTSEAKPSSTGTSSVTKSISPSSTQSETKGSNHEVATPTNQSIQTSVTDSPSSTWATGDSFWSSYFNTPSKEVVSSQTPSSSTRKNEPISSKGNGKPSSSKKPAPVSSSTPVGSGNSNSKAAVTPSSRGDRQKRASPRVSLNSPAMTSTPLNETRHESGKEKRATELSVTEEELATKPVALHPDPAMEVKPNLRESSGITVTEMASTLGSQSSPVFTNQTSSGEVTTNVSKPEKETVNTSASVVEAQMVSGSLDYITQASLPPVPTKVRHTDSPQSKTHPFLEEVDTPVEGSVTPSNGEQTTALEHTKIKDILKTNHDRGDENLGPEVTSPVSVSDEGTSSEAPPQKEPPDHPPDGGTSSASPVSEPSMTSPTPLQEEAISMTSSTAQEEAISMTSSTAQEEAISMTSSTAQEEAISMTSSTAQEEVTLMTSSTAREEATSMTSSTAREEAISMTSSTAREEAISMTSSTAQEEAISMTSSTAQEEAISMTSSTAQEEAISMTSSTAQEEVTLMTSSTAREEATSMTSPTAREEAISMTSSTAREEAISITSSAAPEQATPIEVQPCNLPSSPTPSPDSSEVVKSKHNEVQVESLQQAAVTLESSHASQERKSSTGQEIQVATVSENEKGTTSPPPSTDVEVEETKGELEKELRRVSEVLNVRESKMLQMSTQNIELMESNQELQRQLSEAQESMRMGQMDVEEVMAEFTRRIGTSEKKLQTVVKERDSLKKQLQALQNEQSYQKRSAEQELSELLREKEEQIAGLMDEGEKLSKQQLQNSNVIKKLRQKEKQNDQLLAAQRQQIEDCETEMRRLKELVKKREENEKKYQESLSQLNTIAEQQAKELTTLKGERDELTDKVRSLQSNLDNSYKKLSELQKANAVTQSAAHKAALSADLSAREELMSVLEEQKVEGQREKESLVMQLNELRMSVTRAEQQTAWREDHMRQEVANMQQRLQEAEGRNQELTSSISEATKPLLRQIENLQVAHSTQAGNWEKVETSLTQRLVECQSQLSSAVEKERNAVEKELTFQARVSALETQLTSLRQERSQLLASLELERAKLETLEEGQQRDSAKMEALRTSCQRSLEDIRKEKEMLERQLEYERVRLEAESRKACLESQEKERLRSQLANSLSSLKRTVSRQSSTGSVQSQSDILEKSLLSDRGGIVESLQYSRVPLTSASVLEHLQSLLKQKEGELSNSQSLVGSLERSRSAMAEDLASVSAEKEALAREIENIPVLKQKLQEVQQKYEALLLMYGEKAEETEELKLDIQDLKAMYRQQIDELMSGRR